MTIRKIETKEDFNSFINKEGTINCVKFGANWCGPCHALDNRLSQVNDGELDGALFGVVNVEDLSEVAEEMGIMNIPVISLFKNGEEVDRIVGLCEWGEINNRIQNAK
jgi:thioredoxin 1